MFIRIISIVLLAISFCSAQQLGFYWENDGTFAKPNDSSDRHYTNGNRIDFSWKSNEASLKEFALKFPGREDLSVDDVNCNKGIFIGQHIQTPDHIAHPELRSYPEMHYAGWLYGGFFLQFADVKSMDHLEVSLGVIGPSARADESQDFIHAMRGLERPVDWETQMSDRFAGNMNWLHRFRIGDRHYFADGNPVYFDLTGETSMAVGTVHRNVSAGFILRTGTNLPANFGPSSIAQPRYYLPEKHNKCIMAFLRCAGYIVEHNEFLNDLDKETLRGEIQGGIAIIYNSLEFNYSQVYMSRQYENQEASDSFGSFNCVMRF